MQVEVLQKVKVDVSFVEVSVPVRYGTEDIPEDFPLRKGDMWTARIAVDAGRIVDWPQQEEPLLLDMKVVDEGVYTLYNHCGEQVGEPLRDYVPHGLIPGRYGDYIELEIATDGYITDWPTTPDLRAFFSVDED